jgi:hypothetical protein
MSAEAQPTQPASDDAYLSRSRITMYERLGYVSGAVLLVSLWLPWYKTNGDNPNSKITSSGTGPGESANAWEVFGLLPWLLVLLAIAPVILTWIVARGYKLSYRPGEVTMVAGMIGVTLVLCNGIILGKPEPDIDISLAIGWYLALLACILIVTAGFQRQALHASGQRKPPGSVN